MNNLRPTNKSNPLKETTEYLTKDIEIPSPFQKDTKTARSPVRVTKINPEMEVNIVETPKTIAVSTRERHITPRSTPSDSFFGTVSAMDDRPELDTQQNMVHPQPRHNQ